MSEVLIWNKVWGQDLESKTTHLHPWIFRLTIIVIIIIIIIIIIIVIIIIIIIIIIDSIQFANKKSWRGTTLHLPNSYWSEIGLGSVFEE